MRHCEAAHAELDRLADGAVQVGVLPEWTRVQGKAAWFVARGPYSELGKVWETFHYKVEAARGGRPAGPAGDVYACRPEDHADDQQAGLLTILYLPVE